MNTHFSWTELPAELWVSICHYLTPRDLITLRSVSPLLSRLAATDFSKRANEIAILFFTRGIQAQNSPSEMKDFPTVRTIQAEVTSMSLWKLRIDAHSETLSSLFPNIKYLHLRDCCLPYSFLKEVVQCRDLEVLEAGICQKPLSEDLALLQCCKKLRRLNLSGNTIADAPSHPLRSFPLSLEQLIVRRCRFADHHLADLQQLSRLVELDVSLNPNVVGQAFPQLPKSLTILKATECALSDVALQSLSQHTQLCTLIVSRNWAIYGNSLNTIPNSITALDISNCSIGKKTIKKLLYSLPHLKELDLSFNERLSQSHCNLFRNRNVEVTFNNNGCSLL